MSGLKTQETQRSVSAFIDSIDKSSKRKDALILLELIQSISGQTARIWGNKKIPDFIIACGKYTYQRKNSNEELDWFKLGFAPRKTKLTVYLYYDIKSEEILLNNLGKCTWGSGCLYINKLEDVDLEVLRLLMQKCFAT